MWFARINMTDLTARVEESPEAYKHLAGRGNVASFCFGIEESYTTFDAWLARQPGSAPNLSGRTIGSRYQKEL